MQRKRVLFYLMKLAGVQVHSMAYHLHGQLLNTCMKIPRLLQKQFSRLITMNLTKCRPFSRIKNYKVEVREINDKVISSTK